MIATEEQFFTFGKYKGRDIKSKIHEDFNYVNWCVNNVKFFKLSKENAELFYKQADRNKDFNRNNKNLVEGRDIDFQEMGDYADVAFFATWGQD